MIWWFLGYSIFLLDFVFFIFLRFFFVCLLFGYFYSVVLIFFNRIKFIFIDYFFVSLNIVSIMFLKLFVVNRFGLVCELVDMDMRNTGVNIKFWVRFLSFLVFFGVSSWFIVKMEIISVLYRGFKDYRIWIWIYIKFLIDIDFLYIVDV